MKANIQIFVMLLLLVLYLNGNISFNSPTALYAAYKEKKETKEVRDIVLKYRNKAIIKYNGVVCAKEEMIGDIKNSPKLTDFEKRKIILAIKYSKVIIADFSESNSDYLKTLRGFYVGKEKIDSHYYIMISNKLTSQEDIRGTVLHELTHLKDDVLVDGLKTYSELNYIDIVDKTLTPAKLDQKICNLLQLYRGDRKISDNEEAFYKYLRSGIYNLVTSNIGYITSDEEMYVRITMLRKYLLEHGQIKTMDQDLTNENFIFLFSPGVVLEEPIPQFLELMFLMKIDISGDKRMLKVNCLDAINKMP